MELRWLIYQNAVTAADVAAYQDEHGVTLAVAKSRLQMRTAPVLQYRNGMGYDWQDVPTVVIPHPTNT